MYTVTVLYADVDTLPRNELLLADTVTVTFARIGSDTDWAGELDG
jgi:hypothetical protein